MLEVKGLTRAFGGVIAVNDVDFCIKKGELVGLIGPNGAGKTTVFNLVTGFIRPTRGKIIFEGKDITRQKPHSIAEMGLVRTFQASNIFPDFTVEQNLVAASHLKPRVNFWEAALHTRGNHKKEEDILKRAVEIIRLVGLEDMKNRIAGSLPHKHKRILGIAMALAVEPKLLLLDEPLGGMAVDEVHEATDLIRKIWRNGTTILLIEHNMKATMVLCQRIAVLSFGKKIGEGTPQEVQENPEVIRAYLGVGAHAA